MAQSPYTPKAQEARNKTIVERYFREALDQRRFDLLPDLLARDVVLHRPGFDVTGLDAAVQRLRAVFQDYSAFSTELSGLIAEGEMVAVRVTHRARARPHTFHSRAGDVKLPAEQDLHWTAIVQFRLKDGKIAEEWVMRDELGMLLQLGKIRVGD
jgi:predicted SnoaL-like aldol condensation-catalyzing enzyme